MSFRPVFSCTRHLSSALVRRSPALLRAPTVAWSPSLLSFHSLAGGRGNLQLVRRQMARSYSTLKQETSNSSHLVGSAVFLGMFGAFFAGYLYLRDQKQNEVRSVGTPSLGGPFVLSDLDGNKVDSEDLKGKVLLIYFGFTHCPDICPSELTKVAEVVDMLERRKKQWGELVLPIFISIDPKRDTPDRIRAYVRDFHPRMLGLVGTDEQLKDVCKKFRIFYSEVRADEDDADDYVLDHTIITYMIGDDGEFKEYFGFNKNAKEMADVISTYLPKEWWEFWL